jgi:hypothetical protein
MGGAKYGPVESRVPRHCGGGRWRDFGVALRASAQRRCTHPIGWRLRLRLRHGGCRGLLSGVPGGEPRQLLGRQVLRPRVDRLGWRAIKGDALVVGKYGLAVDRCHFPAAKHAERVGKRPAHSRGDLVGDAQCQGANVLMLDWECERPSLPKRTELLDQRFLGSNHIRPRPQVCRTKYG